MLKNEYGIPMTTMAKMLGVSRKTLCNAYNKKLVSKKLAKQLEDFKNSWSFEPEHQVWVQGWITDMDHYKVSSKGYLYPITKMRLPLRADAPPEPADHLVQYTKKIAKSNRDAMEFHGDQPEFPKYDCILVCVKCDFKIKGRVRHRLESRNCPICNNLLRPCIECAHYGSCIQQKECFYRKRTTGIKCRQCNTVLSTKNNSNLQCSCGYINTWKNPEDFKTINQENGFSE